VELKGVEPPPENAGKTGGPPESGAKCGALGAREAPTDPDLSAVVTAWPKLTPATRAAIVAMIGAAK
jgi:hypothetical protein